MQICLSSLFEGSVTSSLQDFQFICQAKLLTAVPGSTNQPDLLKLVHLFKVYICIHLYYYLSSELTSVRDTHIFKEDYTYSLKSSVYDMKMCELSYKNKCKRDFQYF